MLDYSSPMLPAFTSNSCFKPLFLVLAAVLAVGGSGCVSAGASHLEGERTNYNVAIQNTNDQQLLLNLVRLKYRDTPYFLEVSNVTSQFTLTANASANASIPEGLASTFGLGAGAEIQEKPTIMYTPLQGDKFIQRVLTPISLQTIVLLYHSGWRVDRLFLMCLQRLNEVKNAPMASGPTPDEAPEFEAFARAASILRKFQKDDLILVNYNEKENGIPLLIMKFHDSVMGSEDFLTLTKLLGVDPNQDRIYLSTMVDPRYVWVQTRSLLGVMYYLSQGVEVPESHVEKGRVTVTYNPDGSRFDWKKLTGSLLQVRYNEGFQPKGFSVAVPHRGTWFYIDDADLNSKSTFSLLSQIFSLQAGKVPSSAPLLTLPIGQ